MEYIYKNAETGKEEKVALERWVWEAEYKDGTVLKQFADEGVFHRIQEIEQERLSVFAMQHVSDGSRRVEIKVAEGMQIFHLYRNVILRHGQEDEARVRMYVFGWKDKGTKGCGYFYILPDERVLSSKEDMLIEFD